MRGSRATHPASVLEYGLHSAILLLDGLAVDELQGAHDPIPAGTGTGIRHRHSYSDPFNDAARPLRLTLGSDCAQLPAPRLEQLIGLSRFPGVDIAVMDGLETFGYRGLSTISVVRRGQELIVRSKQEADEDDAFRAFDGRPAVEDNDLEASAWFDDSYEKSADAMLGSDKNAARVAMEAQASVALGRDYIVSPMLVEARRWSRRAWLNQVGACTVGEAFQLAGLKARMSRTVPYFVSRDGTASTNVGRMYDLATLAFTPGLRRAIGAALGPSASPSTAAAAEHLIAIRARLVELLIARDEVFRLARREALGTHWTRPYDAGDYSGPTGNDVTTKLGYHWAAALNSAFAATDNLAWVVGKRSDPSASDSRLGLNSLIGQDKPRAPWRSTRLAGDASAALLKSRHLPFVLAARSIRNTQMHREGVDYGHAEWDPPTSAPIDGLSVLWLLRDELSPAKVLGGSIDLFAAIAGHSQYVDEDLALISFTAFLDALWCRTSRLVGDCLRSLDWAPTAWAVEVSRKSATSRRWKTQSQRLLWGL